MEKVEFAIYLYAALQAICIISVILVVITGVWNKVEYENGVLRVLLFRLIPISTITISDIVDIQKVGMASIFRYPTALDLRMNLSLKCLLITKTSGFSRQLIIECFHRDDLFDRISKDLEELRSNSKEVGER